MTSPESHRAGVTILIVEDDDAIRPVLKRVLERKGYTLLVASNGAEALRLAEGIEPPDELTLAITDLMMPGMGGIQLLAHLTRMFPGLRALLMSGYSDDAIGRAGLPEGRVSFLQKPFSLDELTRRVAEVLEPR
jgi:two-component system, cell cycle sensor histidine kinase and response regulator CckA